MPEGPEVRRCGEMLASVIKGEKLVSIIPVSGKLLKKGIPGLELFKPGAVATRIDVKGKVIFINLEIDAGLVLVSTLGMSGWWYPASSQLDPTWKAQKVYYNGAIATVGNVIEKAEKHVRVRLTTESGKVANYVDHRNFGNMSIMSEFEGDKKAGQLGVDAFKVTSHLKHALMKLTDPKHKSKPIGELLLDQSVVAGVGNIYRAEILYLARIDPRKKINLISDADIEKLLQAIDAVVTTAYKTHGTMLYPIEWLSDHLAYVNRFGPLFGTREAFVCRHLVYGQPYDIFGHEVRSEKIGGRTMWWVPEMQSDGGETI